MSKVYTPTQIRRRMAVINRNQLKWDTAERDLQAACSHVNVSKKHCADTGNWDSYDDSYWIEYRCPDCGKFWSEDQK